MAIVTKRTVMTLYSGNDDIYSHQVRIVLAEKSIAAEMVYMNPERGVSALSELNPYATTPTLVDRDLVLYDSRVILEYLDERFPHPPLYPVYPVARAETRKMMYRIEQDWYVLMRAILAGHEADSAREQLCASIGHIEPVFASKPYFLSDEFSMLDCALAPLLWRMPQLKIVFPDTLRHLHAYMNRIFARESFDKSLTDCERQLQAA